MFVPPSLPRFLLVGGLLLGLLGLILWKALPIAASFPPYIVTAVLAVAYGSFETRRLRAKDKKPRE